MKNSKENPRKSELDDLLLMIGGLEESIRIALEQEDYTFSKRLEKKKIEYYERLRNFVYGI